MLVESAPETIVKRITDLDAADIEEIARRTGGDFSVEIEPVSNGEEVGWESFFVTYPNSGASFHLENHRLDLPFLQKTLGYTSTLVLDTSHIFAGFGSFGVNQVIVLEGTQVSFIGVKRHQREELIRVDEVTFSADEFTSATHVFKDPTRLSDRMLRAVGVMKPQPI